MYYVDNDFIHKILNHNYKCIKVREAILNHSDGYLVEKIFFRKTIYHNRRSDTAIFYRARNIIYMLKKYDICYLKDLVYDIFTNLIYSNNRRRFFSIFFKGIKEGIKSF